MELIKLQIVLYWVSVGFYVVSGIMLISSFLFKKEDLVKVAVPLTGVGFIFNTVAIFMRWYETGHFPYWGVYEVFTSYAWAGIAFYLLVQFLRPSLRITGALVLPICFVMIGIGIMSSTEVKEIPRTFFTYWLGIHILFAKLAYGAVIISAGMGVVYLLKKGFSVDEHPLIDKLPTLERIDYLNYRFSIFAFIMLMIMIVSGAIWAYKAWGRYWGWDPIETWAFISWLVYGFFLHLRVTYKWKGRRSAWMSIVCLLLVLFSFFGIPLIYPSVHEHLKYSGIVS